MIRLGYMLRFLCLWNLDVSKKTTILKEMSANVERLDLHLHPWSGCQLSDYAIKSYVYCLLMIRVAWVIEIIFSDYIISFRPLENSSHPTQISRACGTLSQRFHSTHIECVLQINERQNFVRMYLAFGMFINNAKCQHTNVLSDDTDYHILEAATANSLYRSLECPFLPSNLNDWQPQFGLICKCYSLLLMCLIIYDSSQFLVLSEEIDVICSIYAFLY